MSTNAPYATQHDLPKYEKRGNVVSAPWMKDQPEVHCGRGHDPEPYIACNSQTAPFATFHNLPQPAELVGSMPDSPWAKEQQPAPLVCKGSQPPSEQNRSMKRQPQRNDTNVHQAPWDRDEVHYNKVSERFPHGEDAPHYTSAHAPFATDSK